MTETPSGGRSGRPAQRTVLVDVPHPTPGAKQTRVDSVMEAVTNVIIGLAISMTANAIIIPMVTGVPLSLAGNGLLAALYTAISLVRSYAIRRLFNGRSVWSAIKRGFTGGSNHHG